MGMKSDDIPDFIFRGAVVSVDGREETVKDFSLQVPFVAGRRMDSVLYLAFKSGKDMVYEAARVKEIPGSVPDFLKVGAKIFCRDLSENKNDAFSRATAGEWTVAAIHRHDNDHGTSLKLMLRRAVDNNPRKYMTISRQFNAKTMTPVNDSSEPDLPPSYELLENLTVRRPIVFKKK
jgi:hypothetical protein